MHQEYQNSCIFLIKYLNRKDYNRARYIIKDNTKNLMKAKTFNATNQESILIPSIPMISKDSDFPVPFQHLQFPVLGAIICNSIGCKAILYPRWEFTCWESCFHMVIRMLVFQAGDPTQVPVYADQTEFYNVREHLDEG